MAKIGYVKNDVVRTWFMAKIGYVKNDVVRTWLGGLRDPDDIGASEYRLVHDHVQVLSEVPDEDEPELQALLLASLWEVEAVCRDLRRELIGLVD